MWTASNQLGTEKILGLKCFITSLIHACTDSGHNFCVKKITSIEKNTGREWKDPRQQSWHLFCLIFTQENETAGFFCPRACKQDV